jgi:glutaryl-CoA dehydrogenase
MARFPGVDYMLIDSQWSEQELLVRQAARQFVDERAQPLMRDCFREARFPAELIPELGRLGFLGANLHGFGCADMNNVEYGLVMQELERADSGLRSFVSVQGALVMYPILTYGSEQQKEPGFRACKAAMRLDASLSPSRTSVRIQRA